MKRITYLLVIVLCCACSNSRDNQSEKWHRQRNKVVDVRNDVKEIPMEDVLISSSARPYIYGDFLVVADHKSLDESVRLFDRQTYKYVLGFGEIGPGPTEITDLGYVAWNSHTQQLYVTDHGQQRILAYNIDSLSNNSDYLPTVKLKFKNTTFPNAYIYINDTLSYGSFVTLTSPSSFKQTSGKWNMLTQEADLIEYAHPADKKKRIAFAASIELNTLVECNCRYDLISLYDLDGTLKCNVYGPNWAEKGDRKMHFDDAVICGDKILTSYVGEDWIKHTDAKIIHIFTIEGDYLRTLDVGRKIKSFCYDEGNNRLIMNLDDEYQFAYLDLKKYL